MTTIRIDADLPTTVTVHEAGRTAALVLTDDIGQEIIIHGSTRAVADLCGQLAGQALGLQAQLVLTPQQDQAISKVEGLLAARHTATCCNPQPRKDLVFARDVHTGDTIVFHGLPEVVRSINTFNDGVRDWCEFGFAVPADASMLWQVPAGNAITKLTPATSTETQAARDGLAAAKAQVAS